jgi:hypothetical protein
MSNKSKDLTGKSCDRFLVLSSDRKDWKPPLYKGRVSFPVVSEEPPDTFSSGKCDVPWCDNQVVPDSLLCADCSNQARRRVIPRRRRQPGTAAAFRQQVKAVLEAMSPTDKLNNSKCNKYNGMHGSF